MLRTIKIRAQTKLYPMLYRLATFHKFSVQLQTSCLQLLLVSHYIIPSPKYITIHSKKKTPKRTTWFIIATPSQNTCLIRENEQVVLMCEFYNIFYVLAREYLASGVARIYHHQCPGWASLLSLAQCPLQLINVQPPVSILIKVIADLLEIMRATHYMSQGYEFTYLLKQQLPK